MIVAARRARRRRAVRAAVSLAPLLWCCSRPASLQEPGSLGELERLAFVAPVGHVMTVVEVVRGRSPSPSSALEPPRFARPPRSALERAARLGEARLRTWLVFLAEPVPGFRPRPKLQEPSRRSNFRFFVIERPLLFDRFEVTRSQWRAWLESGTAPSEVRGRTRADEWSDEELDRPVTFVDQGEAAAFARWRGLRLPTSEEWICAAIGTRMNPYPWGHEIQDSITNSLDLGLGRSCPVGTFPTGDAVSGLADLLGNAAEWAGDRLPGGDVSVGDPSVSVLGGSYLTHLRPIYGGGGFPQALALHPDSRSEDVGFRCVVDAHTFVFQHAQTWEAEPGWRARLVAVGRRWGRAALPSLEAWREEPDAPPAVLALFEGASE